MCLSAYICVCLPIHMFVVGICQHLACKVGDEMLTCTGTGRGAWHVPSTQW